MLPLFGGGQLFPRCKYSIIYDGRMVTLNQADNRIVPPYRESATSYDLSAVTSTTVFTDSALTSLDINADNVFLAFRIKMTSGAASGNIRTISAYNSSTGQMTVGTALSSLPASSDTYELHGVLNTSTLFYSEQNGYEGYNDGTDGRGNINTVDFDAGDGTQITGAATFTQEHGDSTLGELVVFKTRKIFFMQGLPTTWTRQLVSDHYGCIAGRSITTIIDYVYFLGNRMVYRLAKNGNVEEIGQPIYKTLVDNVDWNIAATSQGVAYKDMYLLAVPWGTSQAYPSRILCFNHRFNTWHIWHFGGMKITSMNRFFGTDGIEICEIAFWDVNNSNGFVLQLDETVFNDDGDDTEFDATSGTATTVVDSTQSWTTDEWKSRTVTITEGPGEGEQQEIVSNTATAITVPAAWTVTPTTASKFAIGLREYYFDTADIPLGKMQGAKGETYNLKIGLRGASDSDKCQVLEYEAFKTVADETTEYTIGEVGTAPEYPAYLDGLSELSAPNVRYRVRSKRPGQSFSFRNMTLSVDNKEGSE